MSLLSYGSKREFSKTSEPSGKKGAKTSSQSLSFVIQKHAARRLHYDFRLELDGVLKSWAVPKGPSLDPKNKRLAIEVEDHPLEYGKFEGTIPKGNYGAGTVEIWDKGYYSTIEGGTKKQEEDSLRKQLKEGKLEFVLHGEKLQGRFTLVKIKAQDEKQNQWLLIKKQDSASEHQAEIPSEKMIKKKSKNKDPFPTKIVPMLAHLAEGPFDKKDWIFEIKWDGYRAIAEIQDQVVKLLSRNFNSFNKMFPELVDALRNIKEDVIYDGEIVLLDSQGLPQFQLLQNYLNSGEASGKLKYYIFDILYYEGKDLRNTPLFERKILLEESLHQYKSPFFHVSDYIPERGVEFYEQAKNLHLEGIIAKDGHSAYISKRSRSWLKIKTKQCQEFVIVGFTAPKGSRKYFGSLILAVNKDDNLVYAGNVGTGFNELSLKELHSKLFPLRVDECPLEKKPKIYEKITWVRPNLICEVAFQEWTKEGIMRQPVYKGLRVDKKSKDVVVEKPLETKKPVSNNMGTNLEKIFWPKEKYTKGDLLDYYEAVSPYLLPHLYDRPVMLHRFPDGIKGLEFFQKDAADYTPEWIKTVDIMHSEKIVQYFCINDLETLLYIINLGTIDIHPFLSRVDSLTMPDYCVLDLDPVDIPFEKVIEVAQEAHEVLEKYKIPSFCKTSGKRGLHLFIPLAAKYEYEAVEQFSKLLAKIIHYEIPDITSLERMPKKRQKKVYIDFLQNGLGKSVVSVYAARALDGAPVSTPLDWSEVKSGLNPLDFNIKSVPKRVKEKGDLFKKVLGKGVDILKVIT